MHRNDGTGWSSTIFCERCKARLNANNAVWLELDQRTNTYTNHDVPQEYSQGGFSFGVDCAKIELALDAKERAIFHTPAPAS